ncbi:hypothetical protein NP233_g9322 [Leucocoprinus birnbaumii]|uniref:Alpha/beta-hydrolase n=1 Tax=Leucocoprinus birnbaumii TaxID=56174 RepID=A0AAD5VKL3_9AGAR|nr:hypothetical protein NP233_g9322 [Leucocoprinus birnbaumii]
MATIALDFQKYSAPGLDNNEGPVVILHGLFGSKRNWNSLARGFNSSLKRPIYTLDLRNHGTSPHVPGMSYAEMAQDVLEFIDKHKLRKTTIIGHSMGGKVAMAIALDPHLETDPSILENLIAVDIAPVKAKLSTGFRGYLEAMRRIENEKVKTRKEAMAILSEYETNPGIQAFLLTNLETASSDRPYAKFRIPIDIIAESASDIGDFSYSPGERTWEGRTLFIKGAKSAYINRHGIPLIESFFPNYVLESLDTGHLVHAERPEEFKQLVERSAEDPICLFLRRRHQGLCIVWDLRRYVKKEDVFPYALCARDGDFELTTLPTYERDEEAIDDCRLSLLMLQVFSVLLTTLALSSRRAFSATTAGPTVTLDNGTFTGLASGTVIQFLGIPFAQPPIGNLRYRLPQEIQPYTGNHLATAFGPACPQQNTNLPLPPGLPSQAINMIVNAGINAVFPDSEDFESFQLQLLLTRSFPLLFGSMEVCSASSLSSGPELETSPQVDGREEQHLSRSYNGGLIVTRSIALGMPIIYVSMNYRLTGFGFLASKEVKAAGIGNLGLQDQRQALRWVQKYIGAFGGDPTKVTIWGESAGAISVSLHMLANNGDTEGLFRAAFMQSGSPLPVGDITNGQALYDTIVSQTGCSGASDTLDCLSNLPYATLKAAIDKSPGIFDYQSLHLAWPPRADGTFITDNPQRLIQQGVVANIPFVTGDCDDEGTLFSFSTLNVTTESQFRAYIQGTFWQGVASNDVDHLATLYTADVTQGSPYDTGFTNTLTPQYKRLASFQGDAVFQAPRRFFLQNRSAKQNTWVYLSKRFKVEPFLGSMHVTDLFNIYGGEELTNYLINFVVHLDPNGLGLIPWPKYTPSSPQMLTFWDGVIPSTITLDTFRKEGIDFVTQISLAHPL